MKILQIGLGSMGKRRVRNLFVLGYKDIIGFDLRGDRRKEVEAKYNIKTINKLNSKIISGVDVFIISTPPDKHFQYMQLAVDNKKPVFVEASAILEGLEKLTATAKKKHVLIAPSCTMRFHPAIKKIKNIVESKKYGKVTNFNYHSGQYLPDWHPWENVKDFYVSNKETGAAREIVAFELTWLTDIFGFPKDIIGFYGNTMDIGADIDDTYVLSMDFGNMYGEMIVDVVSRYATRSLILNMEYGQILWRWDENLIKLYDAFSQKWIKYYYHQKRSAAEGYNKNIAEDMYVNELKSFIKSIKGKKQFPNSLSEDIKVLKLLKKIETKYGQKQRRFTLSKS